VVDIVEIMGTTTSNERKKSCGIGSHGSCIGKIEVAGWPSMIGVLAGTKSLSLDHVRLCLWANERVKSDMIFDENGKM
jgi:hypothetical protein